MFRIGLILMMLGIIGFIICVIFVWAAGLLFLIAAGCGPLLMCIGKAEEESNNVIDKIDYVCTKCGEPILKDAWASWDTELQKWVLEEVFDQAFCSNCDGETLAEVKPIK